MIGVREHVGRERILVPFPAQAQVSPPGARPGASPALVEHPRVHAIHERIDRDGLGDGHQRATAWDAVGLDNQEQSEERCRHNRQAMG